MTKSIYSNSDIFYLKNIKYAIISLLIIWLLPSCHEEEKLHTIYGGDVLKFEHKIKIISRDTIYNAGDTIWFESENRLTKILDLNSDTLVDVSQKKLKFQVDLVDLGEINSINPSKLSEANIIADSSVELFTYGLEKESIKFSIHCGCRNKSAFFKWGLVFPYSGIYYIYPVNTGFFDYEITTDNENCDQLIGPLSVYQNYFKLSNRQNFNDFESLIKVSAKVKNHLKKLTENHHIHWIKVN